MKLYFETELRLPLEKVRTHFTKGLFVHLSPGFIPFHLKRFDGCKKGDEVHIELGRPPLIQRWVSLITSEETNGSSWSFIDEGKVLPWPLKNWKHHHMVVRISDTECRIVDDISYECSPSFLTPVIKPFLWCVFAIRPGRYQSFFKD